MTECASLNPNHWLLLLSSGVNHEKDFIESAKHSNSKVQNHFNWYLCISNFGLFYEDAIIVLFLVCTVLLLETGIAQWVLRLAAGWTVRRLNPDGGEIFLTRPDRPWGPPSLLYNGYRVFPGGKAAPSSAEVEGRVELYSCSPSGPSWPVLGCTLLLPLPYCIATDIV